MSVARNDNTQANVAITHREGAAFREVGWLKDYGLVKLITEEGERFPVLIDRGTGIPVRLVLRYSFEERCRGGAARIEDRVRRIGELYQWCRSQGYDLDALLLRGARMSIQHVCRALYDVQQWPEQILANAPESRRGQLSTICSPGLHNRRITAWLSFMGFCSVPHNWRSGECEETREERRERRFYLEEIKGVLDSRRQPLRECDSHSPLSENEQSAVDLVLGAAASSPFRKNTRFRNTLMVRTGRAGLRIGEVLKIKLCDLPQEPGLGTKILYAAIGEPQILKVVRRPDDPDDPRRRESRVKRGDREVEISDELAADLRKYAKQRGANAGPYLFVSTSNPSRPLTQSRVEKIIKQIATAAAKTYEELHPDEPHTLNALCWHRFRTSRAIQLYPEFFPGGEETESGKREFTEHFGWASMRSARPYLKELRRCKANTRKAQIQEELRQNEPAEASS